MYVRKARQHRIFKFAFECHSCKAEVQFSSADVSRIGWVTVCGKLVVYGSECRQCGDRNAVFTQHKKIPKHERFS